MVQTQRILRVPWTRILVVLAIVGPAAWIGGALPQVVPAFLAVMCAAMVVMCMRLRDQIHVPWAVAIGLGLTLVTCLQVVPMPEGVRMALAPPLQALVERALAGTDVVAWPSLSPVPADTALEAVRLFGLTSLFLATAQLSWRVAVFCVAGLGTAIAGVGFVHELLDIDAIYGLYEPVERRWRLGEIRTSFINPNHQAGMLLLGLFAAIATAVDRAEVAARAGDQRTAERAADMVWLGVGMVLLQLLALVLSASRGALIAFVLCSPGAVWLAARGRTRGEGVRLSPGRAVLAALFAAVFVALVVHTAWDEVLSLVMLPQHGLTAETKFRTALDALGLVAWAPVLGIGRGAFVDLFPQVDSEPSRIVFAHLESAPLAMIVEWGPWVGGAALLGFAVWWVECMRRSARAGSGRARMIALLGLLALAIQSLGDYALEFLGVAAPACAMAGGLTPARTWRWSCRGVRWAVLAVGGPLLALAWLAVPHTWPARAQSPVSVRSPATASASELRWRPLDARLHRQLARRAARDGRWHQALRRARAAALLRPSSLDGQLLLSTVERVLGHDRAADAALAHGLQLLERPLPRPLVEHLLLTFPDPHDLHPLLPSGPRAWARIARPLAHANPAYGDRLAALRSDMRPADPQPLWLRAELALRAGHPGLALHHARLARPLAPDRSQTHWVLARAYRSFEPPRERDAQTVLEQALQQARGWPAAEVARLEELLIRSLLATGTPEDVLRAKALVPKLLGRPAKPEVAKRRRKLAARVDRRVFEQ